MTDQPSQLRDLVLENLRLADNPLSNQTLGQAVIEALQQAGVDLRRGPSLEEVKCLLVEVLESVRESTTDPEHTAA